MTRSKKYKRTKPGTSPGSLIHIGEKKLDQTQITVFDFNTDFLEEKRCENIEQCFEYGDNENLSWINIDGLHDTETIRKIGEHYNVHPLTLEDILDTSLRPKVDDMDHYIFISLKMLRYDTNTNMINQEQISIILTGLDIISFQESAGDVFTPIRERLRSAKGRMRRLGSDYFAYTLIDAIVDNYFIVVEKIGERLEELDTEIIEHPTVKTLTKIHELKGELIKLRKAVWPLRDMISSLERMESDLIRDSTSIYLRDLYDHSIQIIDTIETSRDITNGLFDIYLSSINNRTNDIMKLLTMMASIFIPLTFIVGVYGMNFNNMPELEMTYGYHITWGIMAIIAIGMLYMFRKKGWL